MSHEESMSMSDEPQDETMSMGQPDQEPMSMGQHRPRGRPAGHPHPPKAPSTAKTGPDLEPAPGRRRPAESKEIHIEINLEAILQL